MGRKPSGVKGYTPEQIKALFSRDDKYKIGMRLYAVFQVSLGKPPRQLEEVYNTSFKQIHNWVHRFEEEGLEGLKDKPGRGRQPRLSPEQQQEVSALLEQQTPSLHGYNTETWTGPLLIDWIRKNYNIQFKKAQIYNIAKQLGFTFQKGKSSYPEADPEQQQQFKEDLKKTP
jgi:transposase